MLGSSVYREGAFRGRSSPGVDDGRRCDVRDAGRNRLVLFAAVAGLLAVAAISAGSTPTGGPAEPSPSAPAPMGAAPYPPGRLPTPSPRWCEPDCPDMATPGWLKILFIALSVVALGCVAWVVLGILVMLLRSLPRALRDRLIPQRRLPPPRFDGGGDTPAPVAPEEVVTALRAGLSELADDDADPRLAVIACWIRLEQAAERAGTPRTTADTPSDLVYRLLAGHWVDRDALDVLADLYRQARYAPRTVDGRMRDRARSALHRIRAELERRPAAAVAGDGQERPHG